MRTRTRIAMRLRELPQDVRDRFVNDGEFHVRVDPSLKTAGEIAAAQASEEVLTVAYPVAVGFT